VVVVVVVVVIVVGGTELGVVGLDLVEGVVVELFAFLLLLVWVLLLVLELAVVAGGDEVEFKLRTTRKETMMHFASGANSRMLYLGKRYRSPFEPVNSIARPMMGCGGAGGALMGRGMDAEGVPKVDGARWKIGVPPSGKARALPGVPADAGYRFCAPVTKLL